AEGAHFQKDKGCTPGTREKILDRVTKWIECPETEGQTRTFLITGPPEAETSAIAHEIALRFSNCGRLASSFFFDPAYQADRRPHRLFTTLARDLADFDVMFKRALSDAVEADSSVCASWDCDRLFERLIHGPIEKHAIQPFGPIVVVIGALD
ncbi:hypothetical protein K488DRAFT_6288, partial [Vararia minispora EC-137]